MDRIPRLRSGCTPRALHCASGPSSTTGRASVGRSAHELIAVLSNADTISGDKIVRRYWRKYGPAQDDDEFEDWWQTVLHDGVVEGSAFETRSVRLREGWQEALRSAAGPIEVAA